MRKMPLNSRVEQMEKNKIIEAIKKLKQDSKKRNFIQSYDLIINLKGLDLKKPDEQVDFYAALHFSRGRKVKVCAFVAAELREEAKKVCDFVIDADEFQNYDKKKIKKLAEEYDYFIAQANIMPKIATVFGKILGSRGKMPNPKAGCVVPPKAQLKPLYDKLQNLLRISAKTNPVIQCSIGNEEMNEVEIAENFMNIYTQLVSHLPTHENNILAIFLKLTMGKPVRVV